MDQGRRRGACLRASGLLDGRAVRISPAGRTRATAREMGVAGPVDPRLREIGVGAWEGRLAAEVRAEHPDLIDAENPLDWYFAAPGGEGLAAFEGRLAALLDDLDGPALLITHGIASLAIRGLALGLPYEDWHTQPRGQGVAFHLQGGSVTRIEP